jgi:hypothetical protein
MMKHPISVSTESVIERVVYNSEDIITELRAGNSHLTQAA